MRTLTSGEETLSFLYSERKKEFCTNSLIMGILHNKELCDTVRDIEENSPIRYEDAIEYLKDSTDYKRDGAIIKKLSRIGIDENVIKKVLQAIIG